MLPLIPFSANGKKMEGRAEGRKQRQKQDKYHKKSEWLEGSNAMMMIRVNLPNMFSFKVLWLPSGSIHIISTP